MLYPTPSRDELVARFRGAHLASLPTPSAVLDRSVVARNCTRLAAALAGVRLRPHTKTHKTLEVTRLQLAGLGHGDVIVSTVREAEALEPLVHAGVVSGFYTHAGHSYASTSAACARAFLADEIAAVFAAADALSRPPDGLILSVGATPTVLAAAAATPAATDTAATDAVAAAAAAADDDGDGDDGRLVRDAAQTAQQRGWALELHAGVCALMDLQQLATAPAGGLGWRVDRISQEHGVLTHDDGDGGGDGDRPIELHVGMKLRVWPQHACIAGHAHGWYFVVDGDDCVVDIWVRCRGW